MAVPEEQRNSRMQLGEISHPHTHTQAAPTEYFDWQSKSIKPLLFPLFFQASVAAAAAAKEHTHTHTALLYHLSACFGLVGTVV